jgi:hypothetical protein
MMQTQDVAEMIFEKWRAQARHEERREGLLRFYAARFGKVPPEIEAIVNAETDDATLLGWLDVIATGSAEDIAAALTAPRRT